MMHLLTDPLLWQLCVWSSEHWLLCAIACKANPKQFIHAMYLCLHDFDTQPSQCMHRSWATIPHAYGHHQGALPVDRQCTICCKQPQLTQSLKVVALSCIHTAGMPCILQLACSCVPQLVRPVVLCRFALHLTAGVLCCAAEEVMQLLSKGALNRHVAATKANTDSSRSHCVFSCVLESKCTEEGVTGIRTSCLKLVDLAGAHTSVLLLYQGALICV